MENYEPMGMIGEGTYAKVYKARDKSTGRLVALKKTHLEMVEEGVPSTTLREISLLKVLSDSNHIVKLLCVEHAEENGKAYMYLVFEYIKTDLKDYMDCFGRGPAHPMPTQVVKSFVYQLLKGVAHMHRHTAMHRDLKPQNLLIHDSSPHPLLKLADFGLGRHFTIPIRPYTHEVVTLWYRAPELLLGAELYGLEVDIWSIACIFGEMARKEAVFQGDSELQQLHCIFQLLGTPSEEMWPGVAHLQYWHEFPQWRPQDLNTAFPRLCPAGIDLMQRMFEYDPAKRITAKDAMQHPYFADLDLQLVDALENPALQTGTVRVVQ